MNKNCVSLVVKIDFKVIEILVKIIIDNLKLWFVLLIFWFG